MKVNEARTLDPTNARVRPSSWKSRARATLLVALVFAGCAGNGESQVPSSGDPEADRRAEQRIGSEDGQGRDRRTLYERLSGSATIEAIVADMTARVIADPRVNFERKNVRKNWLGVKYTAWEPTPENVEQFKRHMVEFLSLAAGGPAEYTGHDMLTATKV